MNYLLVAYDKNRAIGAANTLPWAGRMKADMRLVKQLTTGNAIIMGRKTYDSIGRPLPNRQNIVISRQNLLIDGVDVVPSIEAAYEKVDHGVDSYIFGGEQIYRLAISVVDEIIATEIETEIDSPDVFFPKLDDSWREVARESHVADELNAYDYSFVRYKKNV